MHFLFSQQTPDEESSSDEQTDNQEVQLIGPTGFGPFKVCFGAVKSSFFVGFVFMLFVLAQLSTSALDVFVTDWVSFENHVIDRRHNMTKIAVSINANATAVEDQQRQHFETEVRADRNEYVQYYSLGISVVLVLVFYRTFAFFQMCLRVSRNLHDRQLRGITRAWMSFFNANSSGRILNRFSKDIDNIDTHLPTAMIDCLLVRLKLGRLPVDCTKIQLLPLFQFFLEMLAIVSLVSITSVWLLLPTILMSVVFYWMRHVYVNTARSVKRVEALSESV